MATPKQRVPARGDLIWLNFDPQLGSEQRGHRPALVLSHASYNRVVGLAIVCPVTSRVKGYPFEVPVNGQKIKGAVLADHVKNLDWRHRHAQFIEKADEQAISSVLAKLSPVIGLE
jgi:mRNA interferase MazF